MINGRRDADLVDSFFPERFNIYRSDRPDGVAASARVWRSSGEGFSAVRAAATVDAGFAGGAAAFDAASGGPPLRADFAGASFPSRNADKILDHLIQRRLTQRLDRFDDRDFEMQPLVRRPFHPAFRGRKLIDQFQQPIRLDQRRLRLQRISAAPD